MRAHILAIALCAATAHPLAAADYEPAVAEAKALAENPDLPITDALSGLSNNDALYFADEVNRATIRILIRHHKAGRLTLPYNVLDAFRFKEPGFFSNRPER